MLFKTQNQTPQFHTQTHKKTQNKKIMLFITTT